MKNIIVKILASFLLCHSYLVAQEKLCIKIFRAESIKPYVKSITDLSVKIYREYPYCYDGTEEEYFPFIEYYTQSDRGIACLLFDNDQPVGVAIGMPMDEMREKYKDPFAKARPEENLEEVFYLGEFLLLKEYRGKGFGKKIYQELEREIKQPLKKICLCKIDDPIDSLWTNLRFEKCDDTSVIVFWQNVGDVGASPHHLVYWLKCLSEK